MSTQSDNETPSVGRRTVLAGSAALVAAATVAAAPSAAQAHRPSPEHVNTWLARAYIREVFNGHRADLAPRYLAPEVIWHGGTLGTVVGLSNVTGLLQGIIGGLPDLVVTEQDIIADGDTVVMRLTVEGTQLGPLLGIPATGRRVRWDAVDVFRFSNRKIVEEWAADDTTAVLYQLGQYTPLWLA
ncbi:ester cyclase [Streptomyces sp. GESEQ-35]|uniref:ester cyclase n=1 Tax=Streptomyces sp. GESEQ-35 TaxID=2812657 RepID=UPI001B31C545|nr:ester cyclase [Streptomyces sp. GESEQ-35]